MPITREQYKAIRDVVESEKMILTLIPKSADCLKSIQAIFEQLPNDNFSLVETLLREPITGLHGHLDFLNVFWSQFKAICAIWMWIEASRHWNINGNKTDNSMVVNLSESRKIAGKCDLTQGTEKMLLPFEYYQTPFVALIKTIKTQHDPQLIINILEQIFVFFSWDNFPQQDDFLKQEILTRLICWHQQLTDNTEITISANQHDQDKILDEWLSNQDKLVIFSQEMVDCLKAYQFRICAKFLYDALDAYVDERNQKNDPMGSVKKDLYNEIVSLINNSSGDDLLDVLIKIKKITVNSETNHQHKSLKWHGHSHFSDQIEGALNNIGENFPSIKRELENAVIADKTNSPVNSSSSFYSRGKEKCIPEKSQKARPFSLEVSSSFKQSALAAHINRSSF